MTFYRYRKPGYVVNSSKLFADFFPSYRSINVCGMDETELILGRPFGGVSILYKREFTFVKHVTINSKKIYCVKCVNKDIYIYNIYMSCDIYTCGLKMVNHKKVNLRK